MLKRIVSLMTAFAAAAFCAFPAFTSAPQTVHAADASEEQKYQVEVELECIDDMANVAWNKDNYWAYLVDASGKRYGWEINGPSLNDVHTKLTKTFYDVEAPPVAVYAYPDFGGGTWRDYGLKAKAWVNGSSEAMESPDTMCYASPGFTSRYNDNYMNMSFENYGKSSVLKKNMDGSTTLVGSYNDVSSAWKSAASLAGSAVIKLESLWLPNGLLTLPSNRNVTIDLNGYPIIRCAKDIVSDGEVFSVGANATLEIKDSAPDRKMNSRFNGGSIQGGRCYNGGGLIQCAGNLKMEGGTLYDGRTKDKGGAIQLVGNATADLTDVNIFDCMSNEAIAANNNGGAIYMRDNATATLNRVAIKNCYAYDYGGAISMEGANNSLTCTNVNIMGCDAADNKGGALYQDGGSVTWNGGSVVSCFAEDQGGAICQDKGSLEVHDVSFTENRAKGYGGAVCVNTYDKTWLVGCSMTKNISYSYGGAVYCNYDYLYMDDCSVIGNASTEEGGGVFIDSGTIDLSGKMVIKNNDGSKTMDNLVLEDGSYIYDHGVDAGSEIYVRSRSNGNVNLGKDNKISRYKLEHYYHADYGKLEIVDVQAVDTQLSASVFTTGKTALYIGASLVILFMAFGVVQMRRRKG